MIGDLDQTSLAIGDLRTEMRLMADRQKIMGESIHKLNTHLHTLPLVLARLEKIEPTVTRLENMRQRGIGILSLFGATGIGAGAIGSWLHGWFTGGKP